MSDDLTDDGALQEKPGGNVLAQLPAVLWQRRWFVIVPLLFALIAAALVAFLLPTKYESSAVLLAQAPSLPKDVVGQGSPELIDRRIEAIRQQVINRPALVTLIETNDLFERERRTQPLSTLIEEMREAITITPTESTLTNANENENTISLRLAFVYRDADKAQAVTQQIMEKILEINSVTTASRMSQTVQFLTEQAATVQQEISAVESQVAAINSRHGNVLADSGISMIGAGSATFDLQISALERDNAMLEGQRSNAANSDTRDPALVAAEAQLASLRAIYAESHPDVIIAKQRVEEARQFAKQNVQRLPLDSIDRQIAVNNSQIAALRAAKSRETAQVSAVVSQKSQAPLIREQVAQLQQKLETLYRQNEGITTRLMAARAGARADQEQMGERLIVVDPPVVPDDPVSPNRPLILGGGVAGGLGLGLILAMAVELFLRPIRDPAMIAAITGARPLAIVPVVRASKGRGRGRGRDDRGTLRHSLWPFGGRSGRRARSRPNAAVSGVDGDE